MKKIFNLLLIIISFSFINVYAQDFEISAQNVILYNLNDNTVIYEKNSEERVSIASITKIMTSIVALENIDDLNDYVTITQEDFNGTVGYSKAGFNIGDKVTYEDLLYGILLPSGADAVNAVVNNTLGYDKFIIAMNDTAKKIGLENTSFENPIGKDNENNYSTAKDVAKMFMETGYSRLPVYEGDLDKILGVLNQKDFHNYISGSKKTISDYVKPVVYVAGSIKAADLLKKLQINKTHIAIIVDEYGGTAGLVTMEDILEELVGDIYDEHDEVQSQEITRMQDGSYRVLCSTNVEKMFDYFDEEVELEDATTVNGWVVLQLDKLPKAGDTFEYEVGRKVFAVRVIQADERKAIEINLKVTEKPEEEQVNRKGN